MKTENEVESHWNKGTCFFALFSLNDALAQIIYIPLHLIHLSENGAKHVLIIKGTSWSMVSFALPKNSARYVRKVTSKWETVLAGDDLPH